MSKTIFEKLLRINADAGLYAIEKEFANYKQNEYIPFAKGTSLIEVCRNVFLINKEHGQILFSFVKLGRLQRSV